MNHDKALKQIYSVHFAFKAGIPREQSPHSILVTSSLGYPQQVVRVGMVNFEERHDTRANGKHYTAADCQLIISAWLA